jgi:CRISPR-associated protein Csb1
MSSHSSDLATPAGLVESPAHRVVITAGLRPVAGLDRFQPAGFPEIGHVLYDAPRSGGKPVKVCIMDSAPSMANHLETVCLRGATDPSLAPELDGLPYVRCVTGEQRDELVATTFTEGHRLASTYFLDGHRVTDEAVADAPFKDELREQFGFRNLGKKSHPLPNDWWNVFSTIFRYDPNSLVHGILFPGWSIKIPRLLTAVHEALGAARVGSSGVKFDKLGKTTSGQPIFARDEEVADSIRATFVIDLALLRSMGRRDGKIDRGLAMAHKTLLLALALWKIGRLLRAPFRYRSGCDLECASLSAQLDGTTADVSAAALGAIDLAPLIRACGFKGAATDVYWAESKLFDKAEKDDTDADADSAEDGEEG